MNLRAAILSGARRRAAALIDSLGELALAVEYVTQAAVEFGIVRAERGEHVDRQRRHPRDDRDRAAPEPG